MTGSLVIAGAFIMLPVIRTPVELTKTDDMTTLESLVVMEKCSVV